MSILLICFVVYIVGIFVIGIPMTKKSIKIYELMRKGNSCGVVGLLLCPFNWSLVRDKRKPLKPYLASNMSSYLILTSEPENLDQEGRELLKKYIATSAILWIVKVPSLFAGYLFNFIEFFVETMVTTVMKAVR